MHPENNTLRRRQEAILESIAQGATRTDAASHAGISRRTLYNWIDQDPSFKEALQHAEEECIDIARGLAFECAMRAGQDPRYLRALFFYLKCRAGWSDRPPRAHAAQPSVTPELIQQITSEVIHSLQALGVIPSHPEPAENHVQRVQSVQQPTPEPAGEPVGAQHAAPSSPHDEPSLPNTTSTRDNGQPAENVQSVQQPTPEATAVVGQRSAVDPNPQPSTRKPATRTPQLSSKQKDAQRGRAFRNKLHR